MTPTPSSTTSQPDAAGAARPWLARMSAAVIAFALDCVAAALAFVLVGEWCFAIPPTVALMSTVLSDAKQSP